MIIGLCEYVSDQVYKAYKTHQQGREELIDEGKTKGVKSKSSWCSNTSQSMPATKDNFTPREGEVCSIDKRGRRS